MGDMADHADETYGWEKEIDEMDREREWYRRQKEKAFRQSVKAEVARQLRINGGKKYPCVQRGATIECNCLECKKPFTARVADRKRGWAKCCSKSCAAKWKDRVTGGRNREHYGY